MEFIGAHYNRVSCRSLRGKELKELNAMYFKLRLKGSPIVQFFSDLNRILGWMKQNYAPPSPHFIKQKIISSNSIKNAPWIETGTYLGSTTRKLSKSGAMVYSIEPQTNLFEYNLKKFKRISNIKLFHGTSEDVFPNLLAKLEGDLNFWLDGHYSGGDTFQGQTTTPIVFELKQISNNLHNFRNVAVFVDDVRCFYPGYHPSETYPAVSFLVEWASNNGMKWKIEHDIFIAKN